MPFLRPRDLGVSFVTEDGPGRLLVRAPMRGVAAKVPPFAIEILAFCGQPRTAEEIERKYGPNARKLFDDLVAVGVLVDESQANATPGFFQNFASLDVHRRMLADRPRVDGYARAIASVVKPGMAVMDAGTGSGVLATLCALAGARVVYAVDKSDVLDLARDVFAASGVADRCKPVKADFADVLLPERVDVIVTETFGAYGLAEDGLTDVAKAASANLATGGVCLPRAMGLWIAPVGDRALLDEAVDPFETQHGVHLTPLRDAAWARGMTREVPTSALAAEGQRVALAPLGTMPNARGTARWAFGGRDVDVYGWAGWFDLDMHDFTLSTAPDAPMTHWKQQYLPTAPFRMRADLGVDVTFTPPADDRRGIEVRVTCTGEGAPAAGTWHRLR